MCYSIQDIWIHIVSSGSLFRDELKGLLSLAWRHLTHLTTELLYWWTDVQCNWFAYGRLDKCLWLGHTCTLFLCVVLWLVNGQLLSVYVVTKQVAVFEWNTTLLFLMLLYIVCIVRTICHFLHKIQLPSKQFSTDLTLWETCHKMHCALSYHWWTTVSA